MPDVDVVRLIQETTGFYKEEKCGESLFPFFLFVFLLSSSF